MVNYTIDYTPKIQELIYLLLNGDVNIDKTVPIYDNDL